MTWLCPLGKTLQKAPGALISEAGYRDSNGIEKLREESKHSMGQKSGETRIRSTLAHLTCQQVKIQWEVEVKQNKQNNKILCYELTAEVSPHKMVIKYCSASALTRAKTLDRIHKLF